MRRGVYLHRYTPLLNMIEIFYASCVVSVSEMIRNFRFKREWKRSFQQEYVLNTMGLHVFTKHVLTKCCISEVILHIIAIVNEFSL